MYSTDLAIRFLRGSQAGEATQCYTDLSPCFERRNSIISISGIGVVIGRILLGVDIGERLITMDDLQNKADGRNVAYIEGIFLAATANDETTNASGAIDNDKARITRCWEWPRFAVARQNRPLLENRGGVVLKVAATSVGKDVVNAADSQAAGFATLEDHNAGDIILVIHGWLMHLVVYDSTPESQKAVKRVFEAISILGIWALELGTEVDAISRKGGWINLAVVSLYDGYILGMLLSACAESDWRREDVMSQDTTLLISPVCRESLMEGGKSHFACLCSIQAPLSFGRRGHSVAAGYLTCIHRACRFLCPEGRRHGEP